MSHLHLDNDAISGLLRRQVELRKQQAAVDEEIANHLGRMTDHATGFFHNPDSCSVCKALESAPASRGGGASGAQCVAGAQGVRSAMSVRLILIAYGQELIAQVPQGPWAYAFEALFRVMRQDGADKEDVGKAMGLIHHLVASIAISSSSMRHCVECGADYREQQPHKDGCLLTWFRK